MILTFHGGAKIVTGANYLLAHGDKKILVDCGLFQGSCYAEELNYEKFAFNPAEIDFVFVTHSHTDHSGRLPKLYKEGFRGRIIATRPTLDMIKTALPDNLTLIKEEAAKDGHEPLFTADDLAEVLKLAEGFNYEEEIKLGNGLTARLLDAGHILGSSIVEISFGDKKIYFSGDLGNPPTPLLKPTVFVKNADYAIVESAYGARIHEDKRERKEILEKVIEETITNGGTLMVPSFAMERTQELLYELNELINHNRIPRVPIFVDSPLAINLTEVYKKYPDYFNKTAAYLINSGDDIFNFPGLKFTRTVNESKTINDIVGPKVIIAGSGMSNGGRILHHEQRYLPDPKSTILFIGYQVEGTLGRKILDGQKEVSIFGQMVPVNCQVKAIGGYSAHADQNMLTEWIKSAAVGGKLKNVFIVQGEEDSARALADRIKKELGVNSTVPDIGASFDLEAGIG